MAKKNIGTHIVKPSVSVSKSKYRINTNSKKIKSSGKVPKIFIILLGIFIVILVAGLLYQNWDKIAGQSSNAAAKVNGDVITLKELDDYYNRLSPQTRAVVTKEQLLDDMINKKILIKKAGELGIAANQSEVDDYVDGFIAQAQISREELNTRLKAQNITIEMLNDDIKQQLILTKLYQKEILDKVKINDSELEEYYVANLDSFKTGEQVRAEHILICHNESFRCASNLTKEDAIIKIKNIKAMLNTTDFETLAKKYSQDPSADNGGDLGYFEKGAMVKPFEDAAFSTVIGGVSGVIETEYGFHILKVLDKKPASIKKLDEVKSDIEQVLLSKKQQDTFKTYIDDLKAKADVKKFYTEKAVTN